MFHESFRETHQKSDNAQFGTAYDREECISLKSLILIFKNSLFQNMDNCCLHCEEREQSKDYVCISVSILSVSFKHSFQPLRNMLNAWLTCSSCLVKFFVKFSGSYFNILLHFNKTMPAILKDVRICWIVLLQPMMLLNVSKFKYICKCSRSEPKWKVLTKSLDVHDEEWGMKLWEENNLVVVAYLVLLAKEKCVI